MATQEPQYNSLWFFFLGVYVKHKVLESRVNDYLMNLKTRIEAAV